MISIFSFFNKKIVTNNYIDIDIHSHLLPGIDDGVKTLKESIDIIREFKLLGYKKLITTPHIFYDLYPNTKEIIQEKLLIVKNELEKEDIKIEIEASAEYYLDENFFDLIENNELLPFKGNYILFETPCSSRLMMLDITIEKIKERGYIPVMAHPERYNYLHSNNLEKYRELKRAGVLFQVNFKSLQSNSKTLRKIALDLIDNGLVDFIGSDVHRMHDIETLKKVLNSKDYKKIIRKNILLNNI